jgi:signal transduction histidine kinase
MQVINTAQTLPASLKNLIEREPFFRRKPPKHLLMTPLFVQGRFFGSLVLIGNHVSTSYMTSHVSLLATYVSFGVYVQRTDIRVPHSFAAIALEAHSAYEGLEQAVEARTAALEQALAHRQTFISSISHELRTPLYSISGLCAVMQNATDVTPAQSENLSIMASSAQDLQRIVTAVLDMAKLESGGMTAESIPFSLRE